MRRKKKINNLNIIINRYWNYEQKSSKLNIYLFIFIVFIGILGLAFLLSASSYLTIKYNLNRYYYVVRQSLFFIIGIVMMFIVSKINYKFYKKYAFLFYVISILLLILVYIPPFSVSVNGARRAINLGIRFMPSDIAKLTTIIMLATFLANNQKNMEYFSRSVIPAGLIIGIPFILILFQTDLSTSLVLILSLSIMYLVGGLKSKHLIPIVLIGIVAVFVLYKNLEQYQINRFTAFLNPELHYSDLSWQVLNGLFAVSRGGVLGQGYGRSIYKNGYLATEVHNDMIFSVISEEFGFIGSVIVILLIMTIAYITIREALKSKDIFAKFLCLGIGMIYVIQSLVNIGVSLSLIPNTGITLPFISNGGTSILAFCVMFGVVLNISRFNNYELTKEKKNKNLK
ncbi:MAG: putative peptidoglycan glycosyltransferase FtsW [Helcococcus sp.]|nr:putative peptidoglycan glycosyltransferase FtsW [Helcococcus sp.]